VGSDRDFEGASVHAEARCNGREWPPKDQPRIPFFENFNRLRRMILEIAPNRAVPMRTPRVFHRLRALPWISVGTLTFLSAMAYLSLDRASTPIALVFVGFGLFVAITILFEPFAIRIRDDQLASASPRFDIAEMCERFNIRQPNLSTKTNYELHDMKQALALIFAAGRVGGGAEQTPPMVTDGSSYNRLRWRRCCTRFPHKEGRSSPGRVY